MKIKYFIYAFVVLISFQSCDLNEEILDESLGENLLDEASSEAILAPTYSSLRRAYGHRALFALQVYSSDEAMLPTRQSDWFDGGTFQQLQRQDWTETHQYVRDTWNHLTTSIASAIQAISLLPEGSSERAEAVGLLSLNMLTVLDLFDQVPYRDINGEIDFNETPQILRGEEAINTIIANITAAMSNLPQGQSTRFNQNAAKALLARLYLNKAVYVDRYASSFTFDNADMQQVINLTTEIINGPYSLETDNFFSMFDPDNNNHPEIIFAIKNELTSPSISGNSVTRNTTNGLSRGYFFVDGGGIRGSDAGCTLPGFFDTWDQTDSRFYKENYPAQEGAIPLEQYIMNRGFMVGQQYGALRNFTYDANGDLEIFALRSVGRDLSLANHTREVSLVASSQSTGIRVAKWGLDLTNGNRNDTGVDIPVFRLADIYLMRAEAALRSGGSGLADVNAVREARNVGSSHASVDLDDVLRERGFEFYWEYHRRTDQIRFGTWEDSWQDKSNSDVSQRLYPIPPASIAVTPGLEQNQGY